MAHLCRSQGEDSQEPPGARSPRTAWWKAGELEWLASLANMLGPSLETDYRHQATQARLKERQCSPRSKPIFGHYSGVNGSAAVPPQCSSKSRVFAPNRFRLQGINAISATHRNSAEPTSG